MNDTETLKIKQLKYKTAIFDLMFLIGLAEVGAVCSLRCFKRHKKTILNCLFYNSLTDARPTISAVKTLALWNLMHGRRNLFKKT